MAKAQDLFDFEDKSAPKARRRRSSSAGPAEQEYTAKDIEVLEGLEPVRRRPGMYIGGTDERALHHLVAEVLDNAMDEAIAGHATWIEMYLEADGSVTIRDNGRGIPVDRHPKFKDKSALEVILTTLHSGGKFSSKAYNTSGGLNGVGISVVNALSDSLLVEVARDQKLYRLSFSRGVANGKLEKVGGVKNRRGTQITFHPDPEIFGENARLKPARIYRMAKDKAYLFHGIEIRWNCDASLRSDDDPGAPPEKETLCFANGLADYLSGTLSKRQTITPKPFLGEAKFSGDKGKVEWAIAWPLDEESFVASHCNTIATRDGGTHEAGMRTALLKGVRAYGELVGNKRATQVTAEDLTGGAVMILSLFIREPEFQGQTKEKLTSVEASRLVEAALRDHFDHWLSADPSTANILLARAIERADERLRRRKEKEVSRKRAARKLRLPGKLSDCSRSTAEGTELFIVEGDSAGGSAKQARMRETQAVLPLRGKILNVASASADKIRANQELNDLALALGCGVRERYVDDALRYQRIIIMTDADVDGAHIAALLMTFFYREMPKLIENGHLFLAQPPLFRLAQGGKTAYAMDDGHRDALLANEFSGRGKVEISRFKGLGEMPAAQLKETTMNPAGRTLLRVEIPDEQGVPTAKRVEELMGKKPELRLRFIQENASFVRDDTLDI